MRSLTRATPLSEIGEKRLVGEILSLLSLHDSQLHDRLGDDAVVVRSKGPGTAVSVDRISKPVALATGLAGWEAWGRLAVVASCSDLLALNARPMDVLVAMILRSDTKLGNVLDFYAGALEAADEIGVSICGGDTKAGGEDQIVMTALGQMAGRTLKRGGGALGREILIGGEIGAFAAALTLVHNSACENASQHEECVRYLSRPKLPLPRFTDLPDSMNILTATDASDGVFDALANAAGESFGFEIVGESLPYHRLAIFAADRLGIPLENFLFAGGDWNIVCTRPDDLTRPSSPHLHAIGRVTSVGHKIVLNGVPRKIDGPRNEHFIVDSRLEDGHTFVEAVLSGHWLEC